MQFLLRVRKKGVIILPKKLREAVGVGEGDVVIAEVEGEKIVLRPLKPLVVDVDPRVVDEILREGIELERDRYRGVLGGEEKETNT